MNNSYIDALEDSKKAKEQAIKDFNEGKLDSSMPNDDDSQNIAYDQKMKELIENFKEKTN